MTLMKPFVSPISLALPFSFMSNRTTLIVLPACHASSRLAMLLRSRALLAMVRVLGFAGVNLGEVCLCSHRVNQDGQCGSRAY